MTHRLLPPEEWATKLAGTELETVWPALSRETTAIFVVEDGDQVVGCWSMFPVMHVEGVWIAPSHRGKGSVARRLLACLRQLAQRAGVTRVVTASVSDDVTRLIAHLRGVPLPAHFVIPVEN